jgi:hypothetical protein
VVGDELGNDTAMREMDLAFNLPWTAESEDLEDRRLTIEVEWLRCGLPARRELQGRGSRSQ